MSKSPVVQARRALMNLKLLAKDNGFKLSDAIKTTVYVTDMAVFKDINVEYAKFFNENPPPRSCVAVYQLPKYAAFEIDAVFYKP